MFRRTEVKRTMRRKKKYKRAISFHGQNTIGLKREDMEFLQKKTRFDTEEILEWFR